MTDIEKRATASKIFDDTEGYVFLHPASRYPTAKVLLYLKRSKDKESTRFYNVADIKL